MEDKDYFRLWTLFRERTARKAMEVASTEVKEHYDQILEDMALLEGEVFLEG